MPTKHYAIYEVKSSNSRTHLGDCYGQVPSRCLRKIAFKSVKTSGIRKVIDVEEKIAGNVNKPIIRYTAVSVLREASASKKEFKKQKGIGDPDHEICVEILQTQRMIKHTDGSIRPKKTAYKSKSVRAKSASPVRKTPVSVGHSEFDFQLQSSTPSKLTYRLKMGEDDILAKSFLESMRSGNVSLLTSFRKLLMEVGKKFKEYAFLLTVSNGDSNLEFEFKALSRSSNPSTLDTSLFTRSGNHRILERQSDEAFVFTPLFDAKKPVCQTIPSYFSKVSKDNSVLLQKIGDAALTLLGNGRSAQIQASTQPYCLPVFKIKAL